MPNIQSIVHSHLSTRFLPFIIGATACFLSLLLFGLLIEQNKKEQKNRLNYYTNNLADSMITDLNQRSRSLERLAKRWATHNGLSQYEFEADATNIMQDEKGYHAIEWIDANLVIRWAVPLEGNKAIIGLDLNNEPAKKVALERAYKHAITTMTPPVTLAQGEPGLVVYFPILTPDSFAGFVVAVYKAQTWLEQLVRQANKDHALTPIQSTISLQNTVLYNDAQNTSEQPLIQASTQREIYNKLFTITLSQPRAAYTAFIDQTSIMFLFTGITFSLLLAGITYLVQHTSANIIRIRHSKLELQNEKQRLASIIQGINAGTWEWNLQTREASVNETWAQLIGYTLAELQPITLNSWEQLTHPEDYQKSLVKLQEHLEGKSPVYEVEVRMQHKNGEWVWIQDIGQVITRDTEGNPLMMYGTHTDISARKATAQALQMANQDLQSAFINAHSMATEAAIANKAKSEFLASMSHEIRTPMNGIIGMLSLLMREELTEKQNHFSTLALNSAKSLLTLINDILDFSKIEAGKMELEATLFDIHNFFKEVSAPLALRAQEKGIELVVDYTGIARCKLVGDPGRLRQVIINLVGNSIKFTESGFIKITPVLSIDNNDAHLKCTISDTGIGIPNDKLSVLFESFTQVDASTTRKYGGTGLGLAICQRLCELMGGKIIASSQIDEGSDFTFYAHLNSCHEPPKPLPWLDLKKHHVLVVDSCIPQREQTVSMLQSWRANTYEADSSETALALLNTSYGIDILIINMQLPDASGTQLALKITQMPHCQPQHRILLTSQGQGGDDNEFIDFGFNASITKPLSPSSLFNTLLRLLTGNDAHNGFISNIPEPLPFKPERLTSQTCRVLLVEDNPINQEVAQGLLQDLGLTVSLANNGNEAIRVLSSSPANIPPFKAVLMDCQMPVMDGYEATRQIRTKAAGQKYMHIPIIAMTANAMTGDKEKCLEAGMNDYVSKPIDPDVLEKALRANITLEAPQTPLNPTQNTHTSQQTVITQPEAPVNTPQGTHLQTSAGPHTQGANLTAIHPDVWDKAGVLKRVKHKAHRLTQLIEMFIEDVPPKVTQIALYLQQQKYAQAKAEIHSVKGVCANLGGIALQRQCALMEDLLADDPQKNALQLEAQAQKLNEFLVEFVEALSHA
ncbi:response regulator [Marinagarivorans algicola]|uniref:response regulator n=1 Tax=Marinagarivorans algicola TaxID=1513270 RepID=UPI0006B9424F|nr:response regulator [Marinagarivorans algicola]